MAEEHGGTKLQSGQEAETYKAAGSEVYLSGSYPPTGLHLPIVPSDGGATSILRLLSVDLPAEDGAFDTSTFISKPQDWGKGRRERETWTCAREPESVQVETQSHWSVLACQVPGIWQRWIHVPQTD